MVTNHHEIGHTLFEDDPGLISRALRHAGLDFPDLGHVEQLGTDLSTVEPVERRADRVIRFRTKTGEEGILVLEVQRQRKDKKPATWGYYGMTLVNRYSLPVVIVVITNDRPCEVWANQSFDFGWGMGDQLTVRPLVLGPSTVKAVTSVEEASADPVYAAFSVIVHRDDRNIGAILDAVAKGLAATPDGNAAVLGDYIELVLRKTPGEDLWRELMALHPDVFQGPTMRGMIDKAVAEGKAEGFKEGLKDGRAEGRERGLAVGFLRGEIRGRAEGKAEFLLMTIKMRGIELTQAQIDEVIACDIERQLELWLSRVFDAANATDIFGG